MTNHSNPHEITISDVLRLALPVKTAVLAGASQARRTVRWVALLTSWNDLATQVHTGDLVLVPPHLQQQLSEQNLQSKLQNLTDFGISGIILFEPISDKFADLLTELSTSLLILPPDLSVREIHRGIATLLVDRQFATAERGMQLYRKLAEMSREEQGLGAMTELISKLTGKIVIIQDKRLEIKSTSEPRTVNTDLDLPTILELITQGEQ
ncbi:MAG: hypothetical protein DWQ04_34315 [Chloroflexi bacterium]|nr:MAG: hypothetical protein DWQ04_34315 [Chloroflexota bacterium]